MTPEALIELRGLSKTYGAGDAAFKALRGVDLAHPPAGNSSPSWAPAVPANPP